MLVSVVIPAYNHEKFIEKTIKSIINQTYQNIELIILDDGSTDTTWAKIQNLNEECNKRFQNVHFENQKNSGICITLGRLFDLAQGDFVYLIASDDIAKPTAIEEELNFLIANPDYVLCVGDNEIIDENENRIYWNKKQETVFEKEQATYLTFAQHLQANRPELEFNSSEFGKYETFLSFNYVPNGYLIRKSALDKIEKFTPEAPLDDHFLHLQLSKFGKYKYIDKILFSYRWHTTNTVKNREKITNFTNKTRLYEINLVENKEEFSQFRPSIEYFKKNGFLYKKIGIKNILEFRKYLSVSGEKECYIFILNKKLPFNINNLKKIFKKH